MNRQPLPNDHAFCPVCDYQLNAATCTTEGCEEELPTEGDLSVCFNCGTILEFEEGYFVHELSRESLDYLMKNENEIYEQLMQSVALVQVIKNKEE